jgi:hypothetical protein
MGRVAWENPGRSRDYHVTIETGTSSSRGKSSAPKEFNRFKDLAAKLVKIPKSELDEKREKS